VRCAEGTGSKRGGTNLKKEVKVEVTYTPGYEKRYTEACLAVLKRRKAKQEEEKSKKEAV